MIAYILRLFGIEVFETPADLPADKFITYQLLRGCENASKKGWMSK